MSTLFCKKSITVTGDYAGYNLWKYIKIIHPDWTKVFIIKQLRTKKITVNKEREKFNTKLKVDDLVEYIDFTSITKLKSKVKLLNFSKLKPLNVVYEDENVIVAHKEPNISTQPTAKNLLQNMENRLLSYLNIDLMAMVWKPKFIHRLDHNTCGLLIGAKNHTTFTKLSQDLKDRLIDKWYKALVIGKFPNKTIKIENWLYKKNEQILVSEHRVPGARLATSEVKLIKNYQNTSLVEVHLITGRKHQARIHLKHIGFPICGDKKYSKKDDKYDKLNKQFPYTTLCAYKLMFNNTYDEIKKVKAVDLKISNIWFEQKEYLI